MKKPLGLTDGMLLGAILAAGALLIAFTVADCARSSEPTTVPFNHPNNQWGCGRDPVTGQTVCGNPACHPGLRKSPPAKQLTDRELLDQLRIALGDIQREMQQLRRENEILRFQLAGGDKQTGHYYDPRTGSQVWKPSAPLMPISSSTAERAK